MFLHKPLPCLIVVLLIVLFVPDTNAQQKFTIKDHVQDKETGEYLIGAAVYGTSSGTSAITNYYGFYTITLHDPDTLELAVSHIGYQKVSVQLVLSSDTMVSFLLIPGRVELDEVVVSARKPVQEQPQISLVRISSKQLQALPSLGGETDILKAYQLMPGITQGSEGSSNFYVRGGEHDQNLIMLDDVPLYYVNHLGGFVSIFNSDIIKDASIIKGGFPARYGNRLSSVMDVRMKDGNIHSFRGGGTLGMVASKINGKWLAFLTVCKYRNQN